MRHKTEHPFITGGYHHLTLRFVLCQYLMELLYRFMGNKSKKALLIFHEFLIVIGIKANDVFMIKHYSVSKRQGLYRFLKLLDQVLVHLVRGYTRNNVLGFRSIVLKEPLMKADTLPERLFFSHR